MTANAKKSGDRKPNAEEQKLIDSIEAALKKNKKYDSREPGNPWYFEHGVEKVFQKLAQRTATLIEEQGTKNTDPTLLAVAEEVKKVGQTGWNHANSLGFAFDRAIRSDKAKESNRVPKTGNPFANFKP